jgi:DNA-binding GntR family transcriptional regulator
MDAAIQTLIPRTSLADAVYETLLEAIIAGRLTSGATLTSVALAKQLDVSRTPVQEALRRLAADGLVECSTGRRAQVARFTRDDVIEVYGMRKLLEGEAAARAATRVEAKELAALRRRLEALRGATAEMEWCRAALDCDNWFHERLTEAAGNRRLQSDIQRYRRLVRSFCRLIGSEHNLRQAVEEHLKVVEALERRDAEAARAVMVAHIQARLEAVLRELFDKGPGADEGERGASAP